MKIKLKKFKKIINHFLTKIVIKVIREKKKNKRFYVCISTKMINQKIHENTIIKQKYNELKNK